jgi:hypothetical protein
MSNFQELQAEKKDWTLASDEKLFEKLKYLEDNVVASTHLVHNSINELNRALGAANTTLNNSINAFNQLSFNKFVENVIEEVDDSDLLFGATAGGEARPRDPYAMDQTTVIGDLKGEDEKQAEAIEIAMAELLAAKEDRKEAQAAQDEEGMIDGSAQDRSQSAAGKAQKTPPPAVNYVGTSKVIKLPFVIGSAEYKKHPYAGVVYLGDDEVEQVDLHHQEIDQLLEDKKFEEA